jgi:hypothetical protein
VNSTYTTVRELAHWFEIGELLLHYEMPCECWPILDIEVDKFKNMVRYPNSSLCSF